MTISPIHILPAAAADIDALADLLAALFTLEQDFAPDRAKQLKGLALLLADVDNLPAHVFYDALGWQGTRLNAKRIVLMEAGVLSPPAALRPGAVCGVQSPDAPARGS